MFKTWGWRKSHDFSKNAVQCCWKSACVVDVLIHIIIQLISWFKIYNCIFSCISDVYLIILPLMSYITVKLCILGAGNYAEIHVELSKFTNLHGFSSYNDFCNTPISKPLIRENEVIINHKCSMLIIHWHSIVCFMIYTVPVMQLALCDTAAAFMDLSDS